MRFTRSLIGCLLILLLACSMSAWAQCNTSYLAPLDQFPGPGLRNCNQFPRSPVIPAGPVMVTYSGGDTLSIFGSIFYQTLDLQGYLGCANGFGTEIKVNFSQPVANVSFSLINGAFNEATAFSITDNAGDSQQVTLLGTNGGGSQTQTFVMLPGPNIQEVSIKALPAPNTLYNFMISSVRFNLVTQPGAGTITVNPASAEPGTTLTVNGNGWTAKSPGSGYKTLFDGVQVAQQGVFACTTQPLMSFDVPCAATTGTHTITVQLTDNNTGQVIASQDSTFDVIALKSLASLQCSPTVTFKYQDGTPLPTPFRIGKEMTPAGVHHPERIAHLLAEIQPASVLAQDVTLASTNKKVLDISNIKASGNIITFDATGLLDNLVTLEPAITATHKTAGFLGQLLVRIVIPFKVAPKGHDTLGRSPNIEVLNIAQNKKSSPADTTISVNSAKLVTFYGRYLKVRVVDQYGEDIGDIYEGAVVEESEDGMNYADINQPLNSDSIYLDPVGITVSDNPPVIVNNTKNDNAEALGWPKKAPLDAPVGRGSSKQKFFVKVDGFKLEVGIQGRTFFYQNPPLKGEVIWPDYP